MVEGIGNRSGRRERPLGKHGGARAKQPAPAARWVHPDGMPAAVAKLQKSVQLGVGGGGGGGGGGADGGRGDDGGVGVEGDDGGDDGGGGGAAAAAAPAGGGSGGSADPVLGIAIQLEQMIIDTDSDEEFEDDTAGGWQREGEELSGSDEETVW